MGDKETKPHDSGAHDMESNGPGLHDSNSDDSDAQGCCCSQRYKATPRSDEMQADLKRRLNRVAGQLGGIQTMIDDNRYCGDVLTQLAAAQSALRSISDIVLRNHLETCVVEKVSQGDTEVIDEVMQLIRRFS